MTAATIQQRAAALFARATDEVLLESLITLEASPRSRETTWARAKTIEELERRFPNAAAKVEAAFEAAEADGTDVDYVAVLVAAVLADMTAA